MKREIKKRYVDTGFGFPVILFDVPMVKIRGVLTPDINYKIYKEVVLEALAQKPARLTGNEIKFIRYSFEMTTEKFGKRFGDVKHSAVLKWEAFRERPTQMNWSTEKDLRLEILSWLNASADEMVELYEFLEAVAPSTKKSIEIEADEIAA